MLYLLHATRPLGGTGHFSALHYLGYTTREHLQQRLEQHRQSKGSRLTKAFMREPGQKLLLVRLWPDGDRDLETQLKSNGHLRRICPVCNPHAPILLHSQLLPHQDSRLSSLPLHVLVSTSGGDLSAGRATGTATSSQARPHPASGTPSGSDQAQSAMTPGGGDTSAHARPPRPASISPAGTRRRVTHG